MAKTKTKSKKAAKASKASANGVPQIKPAAKTLSAVEVVREAVMLMDDPMSQKQRVDFTNCLKQVVDDAIADGQGVNLFGMVKIVPRFHTKGVREVFKVFGDPESGKTKKTYPAKVSVKATVLKSVKDALPTPNKMANKAKK